MIFGEIPYRGSGPSEVHTTSDILLCHPSVVRQVVPLASLASSSR
jgi:hypothetical protein